MTPTEMTFFSVTLFLALVALLEWKRRRFIVRQRMKRGLRGYVANSSKAPQATDEEAHSEDESLITAG